MKNIPIYDKSAGYAVENNELDIYRSSYQANMACKRAMIKALSNSYDGLRLNSKDALKELTDTFSLERIAVITAISLRELNTDGRISKDNKEWANSVPFPKDIDDWGQDRNAVYADFTTHPGLLNLFADTVRKELQRTKTEPLKKPSLVDKLSRPLPIKTDKVGKSKEQEL